MANLDRIRATSSSTARTAHTFRAGHTKAAKKSGSIRTITYTAAERIRSSTHSVSVAATANSPTKNTRNVEWLRALTPPASAPARARKLTSEEPEADETIADSSSEAESSSIVTGAATATARSPSGR